MTTILASDRGIRASANRRTQTLDITVLMGGPGSERQVSLTSGQAVADALESLGHNVHRADIGPNRLEALEIDADLIFVALHGEFGEDGTLQHILDERGIRYTGSGPRASQRAMDKLTTKRVLESAGISTPAYQFIRRSRDPLEPSYCFRLPAVVKPVMGGSSVDVSIVRHSLQLFSAVHRLLGDYGQCLVEDCIQGPELTVGVLGDQALGPIQIRTKRAFYDYQAKYLDETTEYLHDIDLPAELLAHVRRESLRAHRALGCRDFSRVDWMVDGRDGRAYCLEVNTIPGFTSHSLLPKMAAGAGVGFAELCRRIIEMAMRR